MFERNGIFSRVGEAWNRAREILQSEGLLVLWMRFLGETVYRRLLVFQLDLPLDETETGAFWLGEGDEIPMVEQLNPELARDEVLRRLTKGHRCLILADASEWVHCLWVATRDAEMDYLGADFVLSAGEAYIYQTYTPPHHRGQGYATAASIGLARLLFAEGYTRMLYCVQPDRAIAYPPLLRLGAKPVGYIGWYGVGRWRRTFRRRTTTLPFYARQFRAVQKSSCEHIPRR